MAGESAAEKAAAARRVAERKLRDAERAARVADAWQAGSDGEQRVAAVIASLEPSGFTHLHDRCIPDSQANIDHLVVGPSGVFVIDAKAWSGDLRVEGSVVRQDDRPRRAELERARRVAGRVADELHDLLHQRVDVRPALCFVGEAQLDAEYFIDRVKLINASSLAEWVMRFPGRLTPAEVVRVHQHLANVFPAKTGERVDVEFTPPEELVVYLFPWKKQGKNRLYVRSNDGADVGYLDLTSGRVSSPSDAWEQILVQLLPHYVFDNRESASEHELSQEAQSALRRFIDRVIGRPARAPERSMIACYRWKKHGKDRLYLNRLLPGGGKVDLGFFDLDTGFLKTREPGATGVLGYCGARFQQLEFDRA